MLCVVCCQEEWPEMYWQALQDLQNGTALSVPTPHPKFSLEVSKAEYAARSGAPQTAAQHVN
jgi:hypothetical protein